MGEPTVGEEVVPDRARRVLLTALGTRADRATYRFGGRTVGAQLAPVALLELFDEPVEVVLAVCTERAADTTLPVLRECLDSGGPHLEVVRVPEANTGHDLADFVETIARAVTAHASPGGVWLSVDVTHGLRHQAVLLYAVALYLASLDRLHVDHVWCASLVPDRETEILDLKPLVLLPQLVHAVRELRETGSARSLAQLLGQAPGSGKEASRHLEQLTRALLAGLPLEAGMTAHTVLTASGRRHDRRQSARQIARAMGRLCIPLRDELVRDMADLLAPFVLEHATKSEVILDERELRRQASLIDQLIRWQALHTAVGLLREWTVSWAMWASRGGSPIRGDEWLQREHRRSTERALNALRLYVDDSELRDLLGPEQKRLARFWKHLGNLRNAYMHFGMQNQRIDPVQHIDGSDLHKAWAEIRAFWEQLANLPRIDLGVAVDSGRVLVSPLGLSPGVLTNAVRAVRAQGGGDPDRLVVVCSPQSRQLGDEALAYASWSGPVLYRTLGDPFAEVRAMRPRTNRQLPDDSELRRLVAAASEVLVNLTGGTTAMTIVAQQIADAARAFDRPVRRFALVDRRPSEDQQGDPWAECEVVFLDEDRVTDDVYD